MDFQVIALFVPKTQLIKTIKWKLKKSFKYTSLTLKVSLFGHSLHGAAISRCLWIVRPK